MRTVSILGPGRIGCALARALSPHKYHIEYLLARTVEPDQSLAGEGGVRVATLDQLESISSEIIFITTQDSEIEKAASSLVVKVAATPFVFHTSGSLSSDALWELRDAGCRVGSIHPLVSISDPVSGPRRFEGSYFCVEGEASAARMAAQLVEDLGGLSFQVASDRKALYHAAAVMASGHVIALIDMAIEAMSAAVMPEDEAQKLIMPLVLSTVENVGLQGRSRALTGPFARADVGTLKRNVQKLQQYSSPEVLQVYLLLGERSLRLAEKNDIDGRALSEMRKALFIAKHGSK